jgi:predicted enzyme related to lactoylglutathione lyase
MFRPIPAAAAIVSLALSSAILSGQAAPAGEVLGVGNFIHVAEDLDKSIDFYRDAIGLELTGAPGPHNFSANAVVSSLYNAPGAQSRVASLRIPGSEMAVEIVEFKGLNATLMKPRWQDPGAVTLILTVRDLDAMLARLKKAGAESSRLNPRELLVQDPDGIFVLLRQADPAAPTTAPASTNVTGAGFGVTVANLEATRRFFREALGFPFASAGAANIGMVPGSAFPLELMESKGAGRIPARSAIHDPGSAVLRLRVRDVDVVLKALQANGAAIVSAGGEIVSLGRGRAVIVRGPDNLFLQALQAAPAQ